MQIIQVPIGQQQITVQVEGAGPLILCIPGMGESRGSFRHIIPGLVKAGYRVASMDLRGHGDSSIGFDTYDDRSAASDALAVIDALGGDQATLIGNSMGAAAAVIAAAEQPDKVNRLVLIGPFVRDHGSATNRLLLRTFLARPWGPMVWRSYYRSLFGTTRSADHDAYVANVHALLTRPGRWKAFQATTRTSHAPAEAALPDVTAATLVVMGEKDRDFPDPESEAKWIANALNGQYHMISGAGHYPMAEQPTVILDAILPFLNPGASHG